MQRLAVVLILALAIGSGVVSSDAQETKPRAWTAQWITSSGAPARDEAVLHFRKVIDLSQPPEHFVVKVSADNQFELLVNQQRVGIGPSRSDLAHWRYEKFDLAPFLHAGRNLLAATVWNFSTHAAIAQISDRIGFMLQGEELNAEIANTDQSWLAEKEDGVTTLQPEVHGYFAADPGERVNGAIYDWDWAHETSDSGKWKSAEVLSRASGRGDSDAPNNWQLVPDGLPPMEMKLISPGKVVRASGIDAPERFPQEEISIPANTTASLLLDNSELTTAYPDLTASGGAGATVRLTYAEALVDANGEKGNRNQIDGKHITGVTDEFLPGGCSVCEFTPLTWRTWRFLQLDITTADQPLRIASLRAWFTAYPFAEKANFSSDDSTLSDIWKISWRTARLDAHDTYMDTPYWERLQYVGDTRIQALISYVMAGDDRLGRQAIEAYDNSRIPDGLTQSRYPSSLVQMIPTFSLLWVDMVHDFWWYRGDAKFVRAHLAGTRTVLGWYLERQRTDGLLQKLPWWPFVDWGKDFEGGVPPQDANGGSCVITLQFVEALRNAAELEDALGDKSLATKYRDAAGRATRGVLKGCWNQQLGLLADTPAQKHFSQHANILGVWLDVIPAQQQKSVLMKILAASNDVSSASAAPVPTMTAATYYFRFYLARALEHAGMGDDYVDLLGPWKQMMAMGLSTWAEAPEPTRSDSHAWSAHPNYDLLTIVAGVHPANPGFESVSFQPHMGRLKRLSAALPTPKGMIELEYTRREADLNADITLPPGTSGEIIWNGHKTPLHSGAQNLSLH